MTNNALKTPWQVTGETAKLQNDLFMAAIDLKRPSLGLQQLRYQKDGVIDCQPLQVSPEPPAPKTGETLVDSYVRGADLIATYAQTPQRSVQPTYYWRSFEPDGPVVGMELMVSMQTSLLDSDPTLSALTECRGAALWICDGKEHAIEDTNWESPASSKGFSLFRLAKGTSYAEMVFPSDFLGARVQNHQGKSQLTYRMFPEFLEKGVIRRGRIRSFFMPTDGDVEWAIGAYKRLREADPPLTT